MDEFLKKLKLIAIKCGKFLQVYSRICWQYFVRFSCFCFKLAKEYLRIALALIRARWPHIRDRLYQYALLMRLDRPIGIFLLLWPTLWALWIASEGKPDLFILFIFIGGVVLMRSAGCVMNDLTDRNLDPHVERTRNRPLPSGRVSVKEAFMVTLCLVLTAFVLVLQLNPMTIKLSFVALILAIIYPFTKRYTYMPQFFLGLAFGWAIPMAFAAQTGTLPLVTWMLLMTTVLWAIVYDTMYAMVDREDDIKMGMKSTAILFEDADRAIIGFVQILVLLALVLIGDRLEFGWFYYGGLAVAASFSLYQQYLIKDRIPGRCFAAFLNNNWFGAAVFAGLFFQYQFT